MNVITETPIRLKVLGAMLALALIAAAAVAVSLTASTTQAQSPDNAYADPQPCGPGAQTAFQPEPHEITEGHFALFDGYWEWLVEDEDDENVGTLHTNLCPPRVVQITQAGSRGQKQTVTALTDSGIDIDEAIFHVLDKHQAVVDGDPDDPDARRLPSDRYPGLIADEHINAGTQVWWLRLDDPDTAEDETSDLSLGFSTMRFDDQYWEDAYDGDPPFRYMFEFDRDPGIDPNDHPHFFAYRARQKGALEAELVWSSLEADVKDMAMEAGELEALEWVFTQPGTYEISVHLQGWVHHPEEGEDWQPISEDDTETSEVKRYVIQVGSELEEVEPPRFGVNRSVAENSPTGTPVGGPITVFPAEVETLEYRLSGEGRENFDVVAYTDPHSAQIVVADGARLDYETQANYEFTLGVTDNVDHESNPDDRPDDTLAVRIALTDVPTTASIQVDNPNPVVGETVTFTAVFTDFNPGPEVAYYFNDSDGTTEAPDRTYSIQRTSPTTETVDFFALYKAPEGASGPQVLDLQAPSVHVTWRSQ